MIKSVEQSAATSAADDPAIGDDLVDLLIAEHETYTRPALGRLWDYYRNALDFDAGDANRRYTAAQESGLPDRLSRSGPRIGFAIDHDGSRREVVVENDIAWRIHTLADFMFAKPVVIESCAADPQRAALIRRVLEAVFEANGGVCLFHDLALLGGVYGFVDILLRADRLPIVAADRNQISDGAPAVPGKAGEPGGSAAQSESGRGSPAAWAPSKPLNSERVVHLASQLVLETVEAPRAIPVLDPRDYRKLVGYVVHYTQLLNRVDRESFLSRLVDRTGHRRGRQATVDVTEVWTADGVRVYHDGELVDEATNRIGRLPVVHIQNLPQPFFYEGLSEVEPLIPLQDELNTRLTDRANRVTLQSFKMYLGKGIENFIERPVGPGQMWQTDNPDASIEAFGGDGDCPSETAHVNEIRDAMDKTSGVTAAAAGLLRSKVGNLTSENALRITMMGLLAKTERKRVTYGKGVAAVCELVLHTLDVLGVLRTTPDERRVRLHWPSPLPENEAERLRLALMKKEIGVSPQRILNELGYGDCDESREPH